MLTERAFRCTHIALQRDFFVKNIATEENVQKWIELPSHTNVVTCYDQFFHEGRRYVICEFIYSRTNMYNYIATLELNLKMSVPKVFIVTVFESVA